jgi:hypothetical protein
MIIFDPVATAKKAASIGGVFLGGQENANQNQSSADLIFGSLYAEGSDDLARSERFR